MTNETVQPGTRIDKSVWEEFRQDVIERRGSVRGHLASEVENALQEYINASEGGDTHDRLTTIEQELRDVRTLLEEQDENKKRSSLSQTTESRLASIRDTIHDETDGSPKVHEKVVEFAIREHAGGSEPTIRRYKELLQNDNELFPHPSEDRRFFLDATDFVKATNALAKGSKISQQQYDEILADYGEDWWRSQLEAKDEQTEPGFE